MGAPVVGPRWGLLTVSVSQLASQLCFDRQFKTNRHETELSARKIVPIIHCDHRPGFKGNRREAQRADDLRLLLHFLHLWHVRTHHAGHATEVDDPVSCKCALHDAERFQCLPGTERNDRGMAIANFSTPRGGVGKTSNDLRESGKRYSPQQTM